MPAVLDIQNDQLLPAYKLIEGKLGRRVSPGTLWRWVNHGTGPRKVKLEAIRVGGVWHTTRAALVAFLIEIQEPAVPVAEDRPVLRSVETQDRLRAAGLL